jgi:murein peptide amidase A
VTVGYSVENRPIEAFGDGPLLVFGAIHGDETESAELCRRWLDSGFPARGGGAIVVPVVNPDGLARRQKDNARGVDLNRNFPARNWSAEHPPGYFPGDAPLSEPESAALARLIDERKPRLLVAVHQPFACVNWDGPAEDLVEEMSRLSGLPARASVGYPTPGSFGSLYGVDRGLPVITLELPRLMTDYQPCMMALDCAMLWAECRPPT